MVCQIWVRPSKKETEDNPIKSAQKKTEKHQNLSAPGAERQKKNENPMGFILSRWVDHGFIPGARTPRVRTTP